MGTSNLNKGPKGSSLLPSDYDGEALSGAGIYPSDDEPQDKDEAEAQDAQEHLRTVGVVAAGDGRQHDHHHNGEDVLQDEYAHHE